VRSKHSLWHRFTLLGWLFIALCVPAVAQDDPAAETVILKGTIRVEAYTNTFDLHNQPPNWTPYIYFQVNDDLPSGSRLWVEASLPGKPKWLTGDCVRDNTQTHGWICLGKNEREAVRVIGPMGFRIHHTNELLGTNKLLFEGKAKVAKTPPKFKDPNTFEYYVDDDWRIPIAYLWRGRTLNVEMVYRGKPGEARPHLFYQGKEFAAPENCGGADFDPKVYEWWPVKCELFSGDSAVKELKPGDYEFRVLQEGHLTRKATFKVDADGSFDNGIASANKMGGDKVIIPVTVLVDHVPWDKLAWKTGAYYGNPLSGFAP
jgi:hypothetical protein